MPNPHQLAPDCSFTKKSFIALLRFTVLFGPGVVNGLVFTPAKGPLPISSHNVCALAVADGLSVKAVMSRGPHLTYS